MMIRRYIGLSGAQLIERLAEHDLFAVAEAANRTNPAVMTALAAVPDEVLAHAVAMVQALQNEAAHVEPTPVVVPEVTHEQEQAQLKAQAREIWQLVYNHTEAGSRIRLANKAFGQVMRGEYSGDLIELATSAPTPTHAPRPPKVRETKHRDKKAVAFADAQCGSDRGSQAWKDVYAAAFAANKAGLKVLPTPRSHALV